MRHTIDGNIAQYVRLDFEPGDQVWANKGTIMAYSPGIQWRLRIPGGLEGAIKRSFSGSGASLTYMETSEAGQHALLAANEPGHITTWDLAESPVLTTRGAFLAAWGDVDISVTIARKGGAAIFGGAGLFLQRISGRGTALIHGSGDFSEHQLAPGQQLLVSTGNLAAFSDNIDYDIQGVGGCIKVFFGGEGLFLTRMTGPGRVLLQTLKRRYASQSTSS